MTTTATTEFKTAKIGKDMHRTLKQMALDHDTTMLSLIDAMIIAFRDCPSVQEMVLAHAAEKQG